MWFWFELDCVIDEPLEDIFFEQFGLYDLFDEIYLEGGDAGDQSGTGEVGVDHLDEISYFYDIFLVFGNAQYCLN